MLLTCASGNHKWTGTRGNFDWKKQWIVKKPIVVCVVIIKFRCLLIHLNLKLPQLLINYNCSCKY